ncbi:MAG: LPS assembly protein LptD [Planctomycetota bacterium]
MPTPPRTISRPLSRSLAGVMSGVAAALMAASGTAATQTNAQSTAGPDDFAGVRLSVPTERGEIDLASRIAFAWTERVGEVAVQRLLLTGNVRVTLGRTTYNAERAVLWVRKLDAQPGGRVTRQVYAYFDDLGATDARAGSGLRAERIGVEAVLTTSRGVRLTADRLERRPSRDSFTREADNALAGLLRGDPEVPTFDERIQRQVNASAVAPRTPQRPTPTDPTPQQPATTPQRAPAVDRDPSRLRAEPPTFEPTRPAQRPTRRPGSRPPTPLGPAPDEIFVTDRGVQEPELAPGVEAADPAASFDNLFGAKQGTFVLDAGDIAVVRGEERNSLILTGRVAVQYRAPGRNAQTLQITAERAVVFLQPGPLSQFLRFAREDVLGIYLEGDVVAQSSGQTETTLRGPRAYYDVEEDRALLLDAVLIAEADSIDVPLYVRAEQLRQEGPRQFVAEQARVANTRFAEPPFAFGVSEVEIERYRRSNGQVSTAIDARNATLRAGDLPFFWWPRFVGDPSRLPLRSASVETESEEGTAIRTGWDPFTIAGIEPPEGFDAEVLLDISTLRGLAAGVNTEWDRGDIEGNAFLYGVFDDRGDDRLRSGPTIDRDGGFRGTALVEHRWRVNELWTLTAELSSTTDANFYDSVFEQFLRDRREFTTRVHLARRDERSLLTIEAKTNLDDFVANDFLLQSNGYNTDKLPEAVYTTLNDDLFQAIAPGLMTYSTESRVGQLRLNFDEVPAIERGLNRREARENFALSSNALAVADGLRDIGLSESNIWRLDTRHELRMPLDFGPINVDPFVVGRGTVYDTDFSEFSPNETDNARLWGAAGVSIGTTLTRVHNNVESRLFDLHRLRHIIEPGVTVWHAGSTIDRVNLPVYDDSVESIIEGTQLRAGIDQTFQTKRGGPGRWRNVDVFVLRTEYVFASDDVDVESPIGRFFQDRPELSNPGEYFNIEALWQATTAVSLVGRVVHDIDTRQASYATGGIRFDHGSAFRTQADFRHVEALDSNIVGLAGAYEFGPKYSADFRVQYNTAVDDFQTISFGVIREFPNVAVGASVNFNNIADETSFGFIIRPTGLNEAFGARGIGGRNAGAGG